MHWAEPLFSKYLIGLIKSVPLIDIGNFVLFFGLKFAPNFLRGLITLEKSLLDRLLSPINFIFFGALIKRAKISLPNVPELPALIVRFFL